eukprot:755444-Rhodomonas_salina.1
MRHQHAHVLFSRHATHNLPSSPRRQALQLNVQLAGPDRWHLLNVDVSTVPAQDCIKYLLRKRLDDPYAKFSARI